MNLLVDPSYLTEDKKGTTLESIEEKYKGFYDKYKDYTFIVRDESSRNFHLCKLINPSAFDWYVIHGQFFNMRFLRKGTDEVGHVIYFNSINPLKPITIYDVMIIDKESGNLVLNVDKISPTKFIDNQALKEFSSIFEMTPPLSTGYGGSSRGKTRRSKTKKSKRKSRY